MRWPSPGGTPVGKLVGVATLVLFLGVATMARVDAARHPEREWKPSLAELPNPAAPTLPELVTADAPIDNDGGSLSVDLGGGLSGSGDAAAVTVRRLPPRLLMTLDGTNGQGFVTWNAGTGDYTLSSLSETGRLKTIDRYSSRPPKGAVVISVIFREGMLSVWVGSERIGTLRLGGVRSLSLDPADRLSGTRVELGRVAS